MQWVNISNVIWYFSWSLWCLGLPVVTTLHLPVSMERYLSGRWQHKQLLKGLGSNNRSVWKDAPSYLLMVATGQEIVREKKILQGQGKVREFHFESGKIYIFEKSQGKVKF